MSWVVYMLRCSDGSLYTGMTNDLERRLKTHASGKGGAYTRSRLPVELVFVRRTRSLSTALKREAELKRLNRGEKLELVSHRAPDSARRGGPLRNPLFHRPP